MKIADDSGTLSPAQLRALEIFATAADSLATAGFHVTSFAFTPEAVSTLHACPGTLARDLTDVPYKLKKDEPTHWIRALTSVINCASDDVLRTLNEFIDDDDAGTEGTQKGADA
jgi:hypothetical protein